jgi:cell division protein ZapA
MKQVDVNIMGQSYRLSCPEDGEAQLLQAVQKVDEAMCKIRDAGKIKARVRIAVLASLNLAFELAVKSKAEPSTGSSSSGSTSAKTSSSSLSPDEVDALHLLIQSLDNALGDDGKLF